MIDFGFELDPFQLQAIAAVDAGRSVLVSAPTGAGKTVVAEHAVAAAVANGGKAFYTTPIKALSNQKFRELVARHGAATVGLLTGDNSVNGEAPIVVMTTEVLRNMLYAASRTLRGLEVVVLDEVHYLQDPYRGPVWEEVIVHCPPEVRFVYLSATVSNTAELAGWLETVRGPTEVVSSTERPVELAHLYLVADRSAERLHLVPTLVDGRPNPQGERFDEPQRRQRDGHGRIRRRFMTPRREAVVERLAEDDMLPAIVFVFSRAGCDDAARSLVESGIHLTDLVEQRRITSIAEQHVRALDSGDLEVLGYRRFLSNLEAGVAAHHAGMVPAFKEAVEDCFAQGLIKVVFATETLALGINMPARTVVIERLTKFNGDSHEFLTPLEYTQLTGRAGRRGIDTLGHAVVSWSPFVRFDQVAALAASRSFTLRSVFRPTYNMAANLVRRHDRDEARRLLNLSFAQFQADGEVVRLEQRRTTRRSGLAALHDAATCELGDVREYVALLAEAEAAAARPDADIEAALGRLRPGDVVSVTTRSGREPAVVLSVAQRKGAIRLNLVTPTMRRLRLGSGDFDQVPEVTGTVELPEPYAPNAAAFQHEVIRRLQRIRLRRHRGGRRADPASTIDHPVAGCPDLDRHLKALRRLGRDERELTELDGRISRRAVRISRQFDDVVGILEHRGYISDWALTPTGEILTGIFHESDLAIAEAIRQELFDDLDPPGLAALMSCFTYEARSAASVAPRLRSADLRRRFSAIERLHRSIHDDEHEVGLSLTRAPDPGFAALAYGWTAGEDLDSLLGSDELSGGDFVRQARQLVDLLRQLATVAPVPATASAARRAADAVHRGVVATVSAVDELAAEITEALARRDDSQVPVSGGDPAG